VIHAASNKKMAHHEGDETDTNIAAGKPKPGPPPSSGADASGTTDQPKPASTLRGGSALGIGSLFLAILAFGLSGLVILGVNLVPDPLPGQLPEVDVVVITLAVITVTVPILAFVGLLLGSIGALLGLVKATSPRLGTICALLGLLLNGLILALFVILLLLGVAVVGLGCFNLLKIVHHHPVRK